MDFDISIVGIGLAREHSLHLPARSFRFQALESLFGFADDVVIALFLAKRDQVDIVVKLLFERTYAADSIIEMLALAHEFLRFGSIVPEGRVL